jgi:hypothetical protein
VDVAAATQIPGLLWISSATGCPASEAASVPDATVGWPAATLAGVKISEPSVEPTVVGTG